jgi:flagellar export protein FliJ
MKRFNWRLQRVLDIKTRQEQTKREELLKITEKLAQRRGQLLTRQRILRDIALDIAGKIPEKRLSEQEFFLKYSAASDEQIKKLKDEINGLEIQQSRKIAEVIKIRQFKEGLERLRAEAKKRFIEEQEKFEQKELDEGATMVFTRKRISELVN